MRHYCGDVYDAIIATLKLRYMIIMLMLALCCKKKLEN
jgi:hypothetical protein